MPAGDGGRLNQDEGLFPPLPQSPQAQPEQTVARAKTSVRTSEDAELVTEGNRLKHEVSPGVQRRADPRRDGQKDLNHRMSVWPATARTSTILDGRDYGERQVPDPDSSVNERNDRAIMSNAPNRGTIIGVWFAVLASVAGAGTVGHAARARCAPDAHGGSQ
jgi:hypothetical protein